jgi:trimeric autotransporter adhesin
MTVSIYETASSVFACSVCAQCGTQWLPGEGHQTTDGVVKATTMWDPDGSGPMPPVLVVGGTFSVAGNVLANGIATYDPVSRVWGTFGTGMNDQVTALIALPNGDLIAGGSFTTADGIPVNRIARWNGVSWSSLGTGMSGAGPFYPSVSALATMPNGDIVAGGYFNMAGGVPANYVARWNGTSWSALGSGMNLPVLALTTLPNGDLVAGGGFSIAGGVPANSIASWNGTSWSALGSGITFPVGPGFEVVRALATLANGNIVAGGDFTIAGGVPANGIAQWNGISWSALGSGISSFLIDPYISVLTVLPNGDIVAGGWFWMVGSVSTNSVAQWNGTSWSGASGIRVGS